MTSQAYTATNSSHAIPCLICGEPLAIRLATGRRSHKPFIMLICATDGRHFRGFVSDQTYVKEVLARLEGEMPANQDKDDLNLNTGPPHSSGAVLERDTQA